MPVLWQQPPVGEVGVEQRIEVVAFVIDFTAQLKQAAGSGYRRGDQRQRRRIVVRGFEIERMRQVRDFTGSIARGERRQIVAPLD